MAHSSSFIRTDKAIMQAFIDLLKEKSFEKITVQDILEKTPVTRATFYAHYHDKYEIAERMLEQFFQLRDLVRTQLEHTSSSKMNSIIKKNYSSNHNLIEALLKIHTERVDLRKALVDEYEAYYLEHFSHKGTFAEARIYAQARAELDLCVIREELPVLSFEESNEIMMAITLKLLRLDEDEEVWSFLRQKLKNKFPVKVSPNKK